MARRKAQSKEIGVGWHRGNVGIGGETRVPLAKGERKKRHRRPGRRRRAPRYPNWPHAPPSSPYRFDPRMYDGMTHDASAPPPPMHAYYAPTYGAPQQPPTVLRPIVPPGAPSERRRNRNPRRDVPVPENVETVPMCFKRAAASQPMERGPHSPVDAPAGAAGATVGGSTHGAAPGPADRARFAARRATRRSTISSLNGTSPRASPDRRPSLRARTSRP